MITEEINNIEGFNLLNEDELSLIVAKMDKRDYIKYGNYNRWLDLERIIKFVINIKQQYSNWTFTNLSSGSLGDTMPPKTVYYYEFKDEKNNYFDIGGIKILDSFHKIRTNK